MSDPVSLLVCLVIGVSDGDTLTTKCGPDVRAPAIRVRLAEVDAPERAQPFGDRSRRSLAALCLKQRATILPRTTDSYGRIVAAVRCNGVDAAVHQLDAGLAWVYDAYVSNLELYAVQAEARASGRGLWSVPSPMAPWIWRRTKPMVDVTT